MPPIRQRDFLAPVSAFTMAIVLTFYVRSSIKSARENAATERGKSYERILVERKALGMDRNVLEDRLRRKAERDAEAPGPIAEAVGALPPRKGRTS